MVSNTPILYTAAYVLVNGAILSEAVSVQVKRTKNNAPVITIHKGYAGDSPGAGMTEITVESAAPSATFEMDPGKFMADNSVVEFSVFAAGKTLTFKGFIEDDNFSYAANGVAQLSFTARGNFVEWEGLGI